MTKPLVTYPDVERAVGEYLFDALEDVTVGSKLPDDWTVDSPPHVQPLSDGVPVDDHPIRQRATVRVVVWAGHPGEAKRVALLAHGHLLAHSGDADLHSVTPLTGLLSARDPDHRAELASFTVRATARSTPIT